MASNQHCKSVLSQHSSKYAQKEAFLCNVSLLIAVTIQNPCVSRATAFTAIGKSVAVTPSACGTSRIGGGYTPHDHQPYQQQKQK